MSSELINKSQLTEQSKAQRVYDFLRNRIRESKIQPGSRLSKNQIALECGVSRAPVSEAIALLASEGLVDVFPQNGSFVSPIRKEDIREALFIRRALETEAVMRIAEQRDQQLIEKLKEVIHQQSVALESKPIDLVRLDDLDEMFHSLIIEPIHSPRAQRVLNAARAMLDRPRFLALPEHDRPYDTLLEHQRIVDAISTGDASLAGAAMRVHIDRVSEAIEEILAQIVEEDNE